MPDPLRPARTREGAPAWRPMPRPVPVLPLTKPATSRARLQAAPEWIKPGISLRVLVVEDDAPVRHACAEIAHNLGYLVEMADSVTAARHKLGQSGTDLVLLDIKLPGGGGFALLQEIRASHPRTVVVMMTAFATVPSAVEAMRLGAGDFLSKPFTMEELSAVLERAADRREWTDQSRTLREQFLAANGTGMLVGQSPVMEKLFRMVAKVALTTHPVLIVGESGVGKEVVARAVHVNGPESAKPFVPVDCGALVPAMLEAELFGHAGSGTGDRDTKTGLLAAAGDGTVFLDEIGDLPLDLQAKLVRALQEKQIWPVGAVHPVPMRARVLAASTCDLPALVGNGRFRKDLFYRLNVVNVRVPPLRERRGDIPLLAAHILERIRGERGFLYTCSDETIRLMVEYDWPGNVRELEYCLERASALSSGPVLHLADLPSALQNHHHQAHAEVPAAFAAEPGPGMRAPVIPIAELERQAILNTLEQLRGDKLRAAKMLGIGKTTLYRKLKEYGLGDDDA